MTNPLTSRIRRDFLQSCEGIRHGRLTLVTPEGTRHEFGEGTPEAVLILHDWAAITATAARGDIGFGETYVAGLWDTPSIEAVTTVRAAEPRGAEGLCLPVVLVEPEVSPCRPGDAGEFEARGVAQHPRPLRRRQRVLPLVARPLDDLFLGAVRRGRRRPRTRAGAEVRPGAERLLRRRAGARDRLRLGRFRETRGRVAAVQVTGSRSRRCRRHGPSARLDGRAEIRLQDYRDRHGAASTTSSRSR